MSRNFQTALDSYHDNTRQSSMAVIVDKLPSNKYNRQQCVDAENLREIERMQPSDDVEMMHCSNAPSRQLSDNQFERSANNAFHPATSKQFQQAKVNHFQQSLSSEYRPKQHLAPEQFNPSISTSISTQFQQPSENQFQQPSKNQFQQPSENQFQQPSKNQFQQPSENQFQQPSKNQFQQPSENQFQQPSENQFQRSSQNQFQRNSVDKICPRTANHFDASITKTQSLHDFSLPSRSDIDKLPDSIIYDNVDFGKSHAPVPALALVAQPPQIPSYSSFRDFDNPFATPQPSRSPLCTAVKRRVSPTEKATSDRSYAKEGPSSLRKPSTPSCFSGGQRSAGNTPSTHFSCSDPPLPAPVGPYATYATYDDGSLGDAPPRDAVVPEKQLLRNNSVRGVGGVDGGRAGAGEKRASCKDARYNSVQPRAEISRTLNEAIDDLEKIEFSVSWHVILENRRLSFDDLAVTSR